MVALLVDRPVVRDAPNRVVSVVALPELGRCESCRHPEQPLAAVTFDDGATFEVGACCIV